MEVVVKDSEPDTEYLAMTWYANLLHEKEQHQQSCQHPFPTLIQTPVGSGWRCLDCGYTEAY